MKSDANYFREHYPKLWEKFEVELPVLNERERTIAFNIVMSTCHYCWEAPTPCTCMKDE